ncbi:MAG TPA: glycosyl hydrolase [Solirubrobacterales bacterium]|nr:glycosyl hydrolase [Solirubrobacterales bacterium]
MLLPPWRKQLLSSLPLLVALVLGLDLLWALLGGSSGDVAFGLVDEPAHLTTCAIALLAAAALLGRWLPASFVAAALFASVAIDLDHLPGYLGWDGLIGQGPRPYSHSLLPVLALLGFGFLVPRRYRTAMFGFAFGLSAHLLRDLATGPGVSLLWPLPDVVAVPYGLFAALLVLVAVAAAVGARPAVVRARPGLVASVMLLGLLAVPALAASPAHAYRVSIGGYVPNADNNPGLIQEFGNQIGRQPAIILTYKNWDQAPFVYHQLDGIWNQGAIPMVTWESWLSSGEGISLQAIANGSHDGYLQEAARAAAGWGKPLMVRFGQEMNADWFPWGHQPAAFRAAWRHMVHLFRAEGATNVLWVWTPYVNSGGKLPFKRYYPGAKYVDWVGFDAINWGGSFAWRSFGQVFIESYRQMLRISSEPMVLAETGSGESGGYKARWLSSMLRKVIPGMRHVRAIAFWSVADHRGDIRVNSSADALWALQSSLRLPLYRSSRDAVIQTPANLDRHKPRKKKRGNRSQGGK